MCLGFKKRPQAFFKRNEFWRLQIDFAVVFYTFAVFADLLHHCFGIFPLLKLHVHLQGHEVDGAAFDARRLLSSGFHFIGAVGAVHIDFIGLLHGVKTPFR